MSLFGNLGQQNNAQQQQQQQPQQPQQNSLFGASLNTNNNNNNNNGQQPKPSLFGTSAAAPATNSQPPQSSGGLFGSTLGNQQQTQQQQQQQNNTQQQQQPPPQGSLFNNLGASLTQNNANSLGASLLGGGSHPTHPTLGFNRADMMPPREKSIPEQMEIVLRKWSPESPSCAFNHYFYVSVPPERAPFVQMPPDVDERSWEEALRNKPYEGAVPVPARGFQQLGIRLQTQVEAVRQLQTRLHEMNNSLGAMMEKHELVLSVRAADAKRRHVALSQRCLSLAIKAQVLSSRGFVLDGVEEELKQKLAALEKRVFDPAFAGREEEIWARMVALRERSRWLIEESEKLGGQISGEGVLDEEILKKTKKILSDYDAQLTHLKKELVTVTKEYEEWTAASSRPSS